MSLRDNFLVLPPSSFLPSYVLEVTRMERRNAEDGKAGEGGDCDAMDGRREGREEARLNRIWISFNATKAAQKKNDAKSATDRQTDIRRNGCGCDITFLQEAGLLRSRSRPLTLVEVGPTFDVK